MKTGKWLNVKRDISLSSQLLGFFTVVFVAVPVLMCIVAIGYIINVLNK